MSTSPVPPGVRPDDGADAAHPGTRGRAAARPLALAAGLVAAVLAGALGGLVATGHRVPDAATLLAVAALVLVPAVLVARSPRRAAARVVVVAGCALLAVGLHPVLIALTAPPGASVRTGDHAAHHGAAAVAPPAAAPGADPRAPVPAPDPGDGITGADTSGAGAGGEGEDVAAAGDDGPDADGDAAGVQRTWAESVAAVDLAALAAAGVDLAAVRDAGYDLTALAAAGLDATTLAAAGADPADEHAPHHVAEAVAAAPDDALAAPGTGSRPAREGQRAVAGDPDGDAADAAAGPDGRDTDPDRGAAAPAPGRALVLRLAGATATALLAGTLLLRAGRASHPRGGGSARVVTS